MWPQVQGHLLPGSSCPAMPTSHDPHCGRFPVPSPVSPAADRFCALRRREHPGLQLSRQRGHGRTHQAEQNVTQISPAGIGLGTVHARRIHHLHEETPVNVEILQQKGEKSWGSQPASRSQAQAEGRQRCRGLGAADGRRNGATGQGGETGTDAPAAGALREPNTAPFTLVLVVKLLKATITQSPCSFPVQNLQETAPTPTEEPPAQRPAGLKRLGHAEHRASPARLWSASRRRPRHTGGSHGAVPSSLPVGWQVPRGARTGSGLCPSCPPG